MTEGHIFIQGIISPWQDKFAEDYGEVNIKQVTQQIQDNKDAEKLIVHIHSPGGDVDEGFGIHDILVASGKEIETRIEGLCASIATVIALAGSTRQITENSEFMIHNPWGGIEGDAAELQKYADMMKNVEKKIIDFYAAKTGTGKKALGEFMKEETYMTAKQALELGFVTEIITTMKAVAKFRFNKSDKNITMNKQEFEKSVDTKFEAIFNRLKEFVKGSNAKALTTTAADGTVLDFGDQVETVEEIATGMTATVEGGGAAEGDFVMPDGRTFVFDAGTLTEIKEAEGDDDVDALKAKITELEAELETANTQNTTTVEAIKALNKEIKDFKSQIKSDIDGLDPQSFERHDPNQKQNRFADLKPKIAV